MQSDSNQTSEIQREVDCARAPFSASSVEISVRGAAASGPADELSSEMRWFRRFWSPSQDVRAALEMVP